MAWLALAFAVVGTVAEGAAEKRAATSEAFQLRQRAGTVRAQSQRAANEERRQGQLIESRARAIAGASGAGVDDVGMREIYGDINATGEYNALVALWNGDEEAIGLEYGATNREQEGKAAFESSLISAAGTAFSGVESMRGKYGGNRKKVKTKTNARKPAGRPIIPDPDYPDVVF